MTLIQMVDVDLEMPVMFGMSTVPRTLCWSNPHYVRHEAPEDTSRYPNISIRNHSDCWAISSHLGSALHWKDTTRITSMNFHLYGPPEDSTVVSMSMGDEKEFFERHGAKKVSTAIVDSIACDVYRLAINNATLWLFLDQSTGNPLKIRLKSSIGDFATRYLRYDRNLPFDAAMFLPPPGTKVKEISPPSAATDSGR